ncbi:MAG TPA: tetratricopeptide repeat protein [Candidimonas sp.]|nr:tetratricopeptide repeat protein [Candidimonas sp.]
MSSNTHPITEAQEAPATPAINNPIFPKLSLIRLRAAAHLYGMDSIPLEYARVLLVGSGAGNHLIPYALANPNAQLLGLCNNHAEQSQGAHIASKMGLSNLHIVAAEVTDLDPEQIGQFDYILVPNLYNILAPQAAQAMLQACESLLSPLGIACIAYDIYPGAKATEAVRDAMLMHSANSTNIAEMEGQARAALALFTDGLAHAGPMANSLYKASAVMRERIDAEGIQSALSEGGTPCYFIEFIGRAAQANLTCIGDAEPQFDLASNYGVSVATANSVIGLGQPAAMRLQYLDFTTGRASRHSVLVKSQRATGPAREIQFDRLADLNWASALVQVQATNTDIETVAYTDPNNRLILVNDPVVIATLNALEHVWPASLPVEALVHAAEKAAPSKDPETIRKKVVNLLKGWFEGGSEGIQYCLGAGPYDAPQEQQVRVMPSLSLNITTPAVNQKSTVANLWNQAFHYDFSDIEAAVLRIWKPNIQPELLQAQTIAKTVTAEATQATTEDASPDLSTSITPDLLNKLLIKLRRSGMLLGGAQPWHNLLFAALEISKGEMPCWGEYISALARCKITGLSVESKDSPAVVIPQVSSQISKINSLFNAGNAQLAEPFARQLTEKYPELQEGWYQLGRIQVESKQYIPSLPAHLQALRLGDNDARAYEYLIAALNACNRLWEARLALNYALELNPQLSNKNFMWGNLYLSLNENTKAEAYFRREIECNPTNAAAHLNLANALLSQGNHSDAELVLHSAIQKSASNSALLVQLTHSYLFALNYSVSKGEKEIYAEYSNFDKNIYSLHKDKWRAHKNKRNTNRKLKIGYLSPDFNNHAVSKFLEPLIANHDHEVVEVYAYANQTKEDAVTQRYKSYVDHWLSVLGLDDDALTAKIRADEIDILVDVAGHTAGNRLGVFARKPAPVSLTWLGYGYTTGLSAIDYFLGDDSLCPPGSESVFAEQPWRLPTSNYVYRADWTSIGEVGTLPALQNGAITFGTLTRAIRINPLVIKTWAKILKKLPSSKLIVNSINYADASVCDKLIARFAEYGVGNERLLLMYESPPWNSLRSVDIGLDCFPHNSGTTLFDTLCMGIPYVTLTGRPGVGGIGASILNGVGHPEWIARSEEEYVDKVLDLASDVPRLAHTRLRLRDELKKSPMMDEPKFARKVEDAYRNMFQRWVERKK